MARSILSALIVLLAASPARAQQAASSFDELRGLVGPGETVQVTNANGTKARGRIVQVSGSSLDLIVGSDDPVLRFSEHDVNNILAERHDSIWNGPLIGLGTLGFLIGLSIDALNREKMMVYVHPRDPRTASLRIAPILWKSGAGLQVSIVFQRSPSDAELQRFCR